MKHFLVDQGQGVAGYTTVVEASTTAMYSCMAILFHNHSDEADLVGLFHYGANSLHEARVMTAIIGMFNDVSPQKIYLTAPPLVGPETSGQGSTPKDRKRLHKFLLSIAGGTTISWLPDNTRSSFVLDKQGTVQFNQQVDTGFTAKKFGKRMALADATGRHIRQFLICYNAYAITPENYAEGLT